MTFIDKPDPNHMRPGLTRRTFLERGAQGALIITGGNLLAACGSSSSPEAESGLPTTSGSGEPVRGGTLVLGATTLGATETLYPLRSIGNADIIRTLQLFDTLFLPSPDDQAELVPRLALEAEPNSDASVWTITLREGVTWHDGKPLTADDVIYSLNLWTDPTGQAAGLAALIDLKAVRKRGPLTVEVPLVAPDAQWPTSTTGFINPIVQDGAKPASFDTNPIGTGPFRFVSFDRGRETVFEANAEYWEEDLPYIDELVVNSSFRDENARLNALLSGQIDVMPLSPYQSAKNQLNEGSVTVFGSPSAQPYSFVMRADTGPLSDPRVREAMKLIPDRQALIDGALSGFGRPGTDLFGEGARYYDDSFEPVQDIEKAKALLKAAGREGDTFTLQTSAVTPGFVEAPTLFAQQAQDAGITIKIEEEPTTTYYTPGGGFLTSSFRHEYYIPFASLPVMYYNLMGPVSSLNQAHWGDQPGGDDILALTDQARAETDPDSAQELWSQVQAIHFTEGPNLVWANADFVSLASPTVRGLEESPSGFLDNGRSISRAWLAQS